MMHPAANPFLSPQSNQHRWKMLTKHNCEAYSLIWPWQDIPWAYCPYCECFT